MATAAQPSEEDVQACLARLAAVSKNAYGRAVMAEAFGDMGWFRVACPDKEVEEMWELALRSDQEEARFSDPDQTTPRARFDEFIAKAEKRIAAEKDRDRLRCTFVDLNTNERCNKQGFGRDGAPYLCGAHGGERFCTEKGCRNTTKGNWCSVHGECLHPECTCVRRYLSGYCQKHKDEDLYEDVRRLRRVAGLRDKHLDGLLEKQEGKCARSVLTCEDVAAGKAASVCPWGERRVHRDAVQVDHVTPLAEGGSDDVANLQALCASCHAMKSAAEARWRPGKRKAEA